MKRKENKNKYLGNEIVETRNTKKKTSSNKHQVVFSLEVVQIKDYLLNAT